MAHSTATSISTSEYGGHKLHLDQNEKLMMFGVTRVLAVDGYSSKTIANATMPVKNNLVIFEEVYREGWGVGGGYEDHHLLLPNQYIEWVTYNNKRIKQNRRLTDPEKCVSRVNSQAPARLRTALCCAARCFGVRCKPGVT
ncbi:unnamed protein product [Pleuronectes platessa]|uniref:Uncharacterized protein n=1 Tax=Pleuronectes platessa TaxID=8262 RepID=A0A9N7Z4I3_PLEPL|nr:unnamed protein product [Pleuronectes platessa]